MRQNRAYCLQDNRLRHISTAHLKQPKEITEDIEMAPVEMAAINTCSSTMCKEHLALLTDTKDDILHRT